MLFVLIYDQVSDFRFPNRPHLLCHVRIFDRHPSPPVVVLTEIADNPGASVTNASEHIATELRSRFALLRSTDPIWIEHYNGESYTPDLFAPDRFGTITFTYDKERQRYRAPEWRVLASPELQSLLGAPLEGFGFQPLEPTPELSPV
jgi:hypothetical protein